MVQKYFQDKAAAAAKAEKEEEQRLRKIASFVAKEIRTFWSNVEKVEKHNFIGSAIFHFTVYCFSAGRLQTKNTFRREKKESS